MCCAPLGSRLLLCCHLLLARWLSSPVRLPAALRLPFLCCLLAGLPACAEYPGVPCASSPTACRLFSSAGGELRALKLSPQLEDTLWAACMVNSRCFSETVRGCCVVSG